MPGLVSHHRGETFPNDTVPTRVILTVEVLLNMLSNLSIYLVFLESIFCNFDCLLDHLLLHVDHFDFLLLNRQILKYVSAHFALNYYYFISFKMSNSPYLDSSTRQFIKKFNIEQLINRTVNDLLKSCPEDPYSFLIGEFQKLAVPSVQLLNLQPFQVLSGDNFPCLKMRGTIKYMNKQSTFILQQPLSIICDEQMLYDEDRHSGKGMNKNIDFINNKLMPQIKCIKCENQTEIDDILLKQFEGNQKMGIYGINWLSYAPSIIRSRIINQSLYKIYEEISEKNQKKCVKLMVNCLQGGKAIGSKCKIFKYYIVGNNVTDPNLAQNVVQAVRKSIVGGKGGEAALKLSPDGTFVCPLDTIMDNLKIVEDAINSCNAKDLFSIGLSWMADSFFSPDTKKYQLQNPKTPFDNDQMIDYVLKLVQDKPLIQYLEDPLAPSEKAAWKKLCQKLKQNQSTKNVKVGSRNGKLFNLQVPSKELQEQINQTFLQQTQQTHPQSTQQSRDEANGQKFRIDYVQLRPYQLKTLTNVGRVYKEFSKFKVEMILQDNNYETYDTSLVDLCYGLDCFSNLGSINKYDRVCKLGRMCQIIQQNKK